RRTLGPNFPNPASIHEDKSCLILILRDRFPPFVTPHLARTWLHPKIRSSKFESLESPDTLRPIPRGEPSHDICPEGVIGNCLPPREHKSNCIPLKYRSSFERMAKLREVVR